jgi:hypothetical protein
MWLQTAVELKRIVVVMSFMLVVLAEKHLQNQGAEVW